MYTLGELIGVLRDNFTPNEIVEILDVGEEDLLESLEVFIQDNLEEINTKVEEYYG